MPTVLIRIETLADGPGGRFYPVGLYVDDEGGGDWTTVPLATGRIPADRAEQAAETARKVLLSGQAPLAALKDVGGALFGILVCDDVAAAWSSVTSPPAGRATNGIHRIRTFVDVRPPALRVMPWELMIRPDNRLLFLDERQMWVRGSYAAGGEDTPALDVPVRLLVVVGDPHEADLRSDDEVDAIQAALRDRPGEWHVEVLYGPTSKELFGTLADLRPHALHFIGHSGVDPHSREPRLEFRPNRNGPRWGLTSLRVTNLVRQPPHLVFLNACRTSGGGGPDREAAWGVADAFEALGARAVLTMQGDIPSPAAVSFTAEVYRRLADAAPIDAAVRWGREVMLRQEDAVPRDWALPSLTVRTPPESVLPVRRPVPRETAQLLFQDHYEAAKSFVDRTVKHRELWDALEPESATRHLLLVTGGEKVGKSGLVRSCLLTSYLQGRPVVYVDLAGPNLKWLNVLCRIRDAVGTWLPERAAAPGREFDRALWFMCQGLDPDPLQPAGLIDAGHIWSPATEREPELRRAVFMAFRAFLDAAAGDERLVLALDHTGTVRDQSDIDDNLVPSLFQPVADGVTRVRMVVVETTEQAARLVPRSLRHLCTEIVVEPFEKAHAVRLFRELGARRCYPFTGAWEMYANGTALANGPLLPGDLLFFGGLVAGSRR